MTEPYADFFRGKNVLLTGHTGFVGSWLTLALLHLGARVTGYSLDPPTSPNLFNQLRLTDRVHDIRGDVRDLGKLKASVASARPDIVFHLAAQALVRESYRNPVYTYETNVVGTANVLESCRASPTIRSLVVVTSDKCYAPAKDDIPHNEDDRLGGRDPYSSSKACEEIVAQAYAESFLTRQGTSLATARAGNILGAGDWSAERLIPDCIRALRAQTPIILRNPDATRPWQNVLDAVHGYLLLAKALHAKGPEYVGAWNFGPAAQPRYTVRMLTERVIAVWGSGSYVVNPDTQMPESMELTLNSSKSRRHLGWAPVVDLDSTIAEAVRWYSRYFSGEAIPEEVESELLSPLFKP